MSKKILIIEDDEFLGNLLVKKLGEGGYEVALEKNGGDGLKRIPVMMPDLLVLDLMLPILNGYEILEEKSKDERIKDIPVVVVSNSGEPVELQRIFSLGVKEYIIKALFDPEEVLRKVNEVLEKKDHTEPHEDKRKEQTVFIVEDDKFLADIIVKKFEESGYPVKYVEDGESAVELLNDVPPSIVLLDIVLPGISGFEVLEQMKKSEKWKKVPIILLSNLGQGEDLTKGKALGAHDFMIKAVVTPDKIVRKVQEVLHSV